MSTHAAQPVAVRTHGVDMFFGDGETKVTALKQADFEANRGELIMLVGPSGCGKTTLLSVIAGTLTPQTGTVEVFGQRLDGLSQEELTTFRRKHLGFVFQSFNLIPTLSVLENVMVPLLIQGASHDERVVEIRILDKNGLDIDTATERRIEGIFFREDYRPQGTRVRTTERAFWGPAAACRNRACARA